MTHYYSSLALHILVLLTYQSLFSSSTFKLNSIFTDAAFIDFNRQDIMRHRSPSTNSNREFTSGTKNIDGRAHFPTMSLSPSDVLTTFSNQPLWSSFSSVAISNAIGLIISLATKSHLHLDLVGTGAFTFLGLPPYANNRIKLSSIAVMIWGTKLSSFLFYRALQVKHDARLDNLLSTAGGAASFWFLSLVWGIICSLPHTLGKTSSHPGNVLFSIGGAILYAVGLAIETTADYQKWTFKNNNPGQFCNVGLWSITQHPNFFGNMLLWAGIFLINAPALIEPLPKEPLFADGLLAGVVILLKSTKRLWIACLSPLFMWNLFSGQADGSITKSVEMANQKYGSDPEYLKYIKNVPLIIPKLFQK